MCQLPGVFISPPFQCIYCSSITGITKCVFLCEKSNFFGFDAQVKNTIDNCLGFILITGEKQGFFPAGNGRRQGCCRCADITNNGNDVFLVYEISNVFCTTCRFITIISCNKVNFLAMYTSFTVDIGKIGFYTIAHTVPDEFQWAGKCSGHAYSIFFNSIGDT